jgi:hypothetical protein
MYVCDRRASREGRGGRAGGRASFAALRRRDGPEAPADAPLRGRASQVPRDGGTEGSEGVSVPDLLEEEEEEGGISSRPIRG